MNSEILIKLIEQGADADDLLTAIAKQSDNPLHASLASLLRQKELQINVELADTENDYCGIYDKKRNQYTGNIKINPLCEERGYPVSQILLHECMHSATYSAVRSGTKESELYVKRLLELKAHARKELLNKGINPEDHYGLSLDSHIEELITEVFTSPELRELLQNIPAKPVRGTKLSETIQTMYDQIVEVVNNIIGGKEQDHPVVKEIMELGAGLMIIDEKIQIAEMLDEAKDFTYQTSFLKTLLKEERNLNPVDNEFEAHLLKIAYPKAVLFNDTMNKYNGKPIGVEFQYGKDNRYAFAVPDASEPGKYRVSYFDDRGFSSHQTFNTIEESFEEMIKSGYRTEAKGKLSELSKKPEFEIGNRVSTLIGELNSGKISHKEFVEQREAIHNELLPKKEISMPDDNKINATNLEAMLGSTDARQIYTIAPPDTKDYTGERFKYGFTAKAEFPYFSLASCPNGAIYGTFNKNDTANNSKFGTIEYPFPLTDKEINLYNLIDFQPEKTIKSPSETTNDYTIANDSTIMQIMVDAGIVKDQTDRKGTDLYVIKNDVTENIINKYKYNDFVTEQQYGKNNEIWYVIPYAYDNTVTFPETSQIPKEIAMSDQLITESEIAALFTNNETNAKAKVIESEKEVVESINNFDYYRGYVKGMEGLIEKVENKESLTVVIDEVQMLTNQYNMYTANNLNISPSYPAIHKDNPQFLKGQIHGIVDGVKTLRDINIGKFIEETPGLAAKPIPDYPTMTGEERHEYKEFVKVMRQNFPKAGIEDMNKLCSIAHEMNQNTVKNTNGSLSDEQHEILIQKEQVQLQGIVNENFKGIKVNCDYEPNSSAIRLELPKGHVNDKTNSYSIPEIPMHKLTMPNANLVTQSQTQNTGRSR